MRASCCVSVLPPSIAAAVLQVADDGAADADRIDAGVAIEAVILDGDDGVLQVGGDLVQRDVVTLLVEAEPGLAVGAVEHGVADPARQPVHGDRVARQPDARHRAADDQRGDERQRDPVGDAARPQQVQPRQVQGAFSFASLLLQHRVHQRDAEDEDDQPERQPLRDLERRRSPRCAGTRSAA